MMKHTHAIWLVAAVAALATGASRAADVAEREVGLLVGAGWADQDLAGSQDDEANPLFGLRYGQRLGSGLVFFGDLVHGAYDGDQTGVGDAKVTTLRGGLEWVFSRQQNANWFVSGGLGLMKVDTDGAVDFTRPMGSLGIGQTWAVGAKDSVRWEVRADHAFGNDTLPNASLTNVQALLGYSWGLGKELDSDGDGVGDRSDQCPNTPQGAKVDVNGCPLDSDNDGVFDGLDRCPGTVAGTKVNAAGCPLDTDGDGVGDARDKCPSVAAPGTADGCPPKVVPQQAIEAVPAPLQMAPQRLTLDGVNFDNDRATLRPESLVVLNNAAAALKAWGEVRIEVAGHTDSVNSDAYNLSLSQRRAEAVRAHLIKQGVAAERLVAKGYGESRPVADNKTSAGRAANRRVELIPQQ